MTNLFKKEREEVEKQMKMLGCPKNELELRRYIKLEGRKEEIETCEKIVNEKIEMLKANLSNTFNDYVMVDIKDIINKIFGDEK